MQRLKLLKAAAKGSPTLFGSPQHSASELDGVVFDGLELGPELQFLFTSGTAPSPSNSGSGSPGRSKVRAWGALAQIAVTLSAAGKHKSCPHIVIYSAMACAGVC